MPPPAPVAHVRRSREPAARRAVAPKPVAASGRAKADAMRSSWRSASRRARFYNTVVAQAQKIEFGPERVTFSFLPAHRMLREQVETEPAVARTDRIGQWPASA